MVLMRSNPDLENRETGEAWGGLFVLAQTVIGRLFCTLPVRDRRPMQDGQMASVLGQHLSSPPARLQYCAASQARAQPAILNDDGKGPSGELKGIQFSVPRNYFVLALYTIVKAKYAFICAYVWWKHRMRTTAASPDFLPLKSLYVYFAEVNKFSKLDPKNAYSCKG